MNWLFTITVGYALLGLIIAYINFLALKKFKKLDWLWHTIQFAIGHFVMFGTAWFVFKNYDLIGIIGAYISFASGMWFTFENYLNKLRGKDYWYIGRTAFTDKLMLRVFMGKTKYNNLMLGDKSVEVNSSYAKAKVFYFAIKLFTLMGSLVLAHLLLYYR